MPEDAETVQEGWQRRSGEFSPDYYAYYGPNDTSELVRETLDDAVARDGSVLELGCSSGRHLAHLHDHGYVDLTGIDINAEATPVMRQAYPDLAAAGTFHVDAIEAVLPRMSDRRFDAVFSVQTLQHIHEDGAWVFDHVARIVGEVLVTVEIEGDPAPPPGDEPRVSYIHGEIPLFHRDWGRILSGNGLELTGTASVGPSTMRTFRRVGR